jgi:hypothetical protein
MTMESHTYSYVIQLTRGLSEGKICALSMSSGVLKWFTRRDPTPICGIYKQKNKWYPVKYWVFRFMLFVCYPMLSKYWSKRGTINTTYVNSGTMGNSILSLVK